MEVIDDFDEYFIEIKTVGRNIARLKPVDIRIGSHGVHARCLAY